MRKFRHHIAFWFTLAALCCAAGMKSYAQTPAGTPIDNTASLKFHYLDGSKDSVTSNLTRVITEAFGELVFTKSASRASATVGDTVFFKIVVSFVGTASASNVVVTDTVPSFYQVLSTTRGSISNSIVQWHVGTITAAVKDSVIITAVVKDIYPGNYSGMNRAVAVDSTGKVVVSTAPVSIVVPAVPDAILEKEVSADTLRLGDFLRYVVRGKNTGNIPLSAVAITDTLPNELQFISASRADVRHQNGIVTLLQDSLQIKDSLSFEIVTRLIRITDVTKPIKNLAYLTAEANPPSLVSDAKRFTSKIALNASTILIARAAAASAAITFNPSMSVKKLSSKDSVGIGDTLTYSIVAKNTGDAPLLSVVVKDTLSSDYFNILSVSHNAVRSGNVITSSIDTIHIGDSSVVTITASVTKKLAGGFINRAFGQSSFTPWVHDSVVVKYKSGGPNAASLMLVKTASRDSAANGDSVKFVITFKNDGNQTLNNVFITDTLPTTLVKNVVLYNKGIISGNIVQYYRSVLSKGELDSVVIVSVVNGDTFNNQQILNTAYGESDQTVKVSSSALVNTKVTPVHKLTLTKSVSAATVFTGDSIQYTIKLLNSGNRPLSNIHLRDTIPFQITNLTAMNGTLHERVVTYHRDTLLIGGIDSIVIKGTILENRPNQETILNTVIGQSDQTKEQIAQVVFVSIPKSFTPSDLKLEKFVSKDTVFIGDTLKYKIRLTNTGAAALTNVSLVDTLPVQIIPTSVSSNALLNGRVVTMTKPVLAAGESDSITIIGQLSVDIHEYEIVLNRAFAKADQVNEVTANALFTSKNDPACRLIISARPNKVIGNGKSASYIEVKLTNTIGLPKADGTPVLLTTTVGTFSNGQSSRVLYSQNGLVSDSLRAVITGNVISTAFAVASADDGQGCHDQDTVQIIFFPGAIEGTVIDQRTQQPVEGAVVRAYSLTTDSLVGSVTTPADGYYLIPVAKTDSFRVTITSVNEFGQDVTVTTTVTVTVSGSGDPPTPNKNSVSGAVYFLTSHQPIAATKIKVLLQAVTPGGLNIRSAAADITLDSTTTDTLGFFKFDNIPSGQFRLALSHPSVSGNLTFTNSGNGQYIINANIAVTLNPNIIFSKNGPTQAAPNDTATYRITIRNNGNLSTTNTTVIDTLHPLMKFVSATGGGIYQLASHRILWNIGVLDSLSERFFDVKVVFLDTLKNSTQTINRASVTTDQTTPILDSVLTLLYLQPEMKFWKISNIHDAAPGDTVVYSIRLRNPSGSQADSVVVTDNLPSQLEYLSSAVQYYRTNPVSIFTDTVTYNTLLHRISWFRDTLFVGDSVTVTLLTRVRLNLEPGHHEYTNVAEVSWKGGTLRSNQDSLTNARVRTFVSYLKISKQALRKIVEIGDLATYVIRVTNISPISYARNVTVTDKIPFGFRYMNGSSFMDTMRIVDPVGRKELVWALKDSLPPSSSVEFVYRLVVGAGGVEGNGINTAQAFAVSQYGMKMQSAPVSERVEVRRGVFTTHGLIIGKVFYDDNKNKYQDSGEVGVKGIELMMEDGTRIITGDDGKYSIPDVLPGEHVIRVRTHTLPKNTSLEMGYNDFARDSTSRFVKLTESGIARADFYLVKNVSVPDSTAIAYSTVKIGEFTLQRIASPRNIVFIEDQRAASMKLTGLNFEVAKAKLRPESFLTLKQLAALMREYPDQPLTIAGHTDSMKIATRQFPNNKVLSLARAQSVQRYLIDVEKIDSARISIEGYGETKPVATNKTLEGRALNRRVEFSFTPPAQEQPPTGMTIAMEIPVSYSGNDSISFLQFKDILDTAMTYVEGSARFGDAVVAPEISGNELTWTLNGLGGNFTKVLRYSVRIQRPAEYGPVPLHSSTSSIKYFINDSTLASGDTLTVTNEVAVAVRGRGVNFVMSGVLFDVAKATLRSTALSALEVTADYLKSDPFSTVVIEGHTDSSPINTKEFPSNMELSYARANTIKEKLISNFKISPDRISTIGFGEFRPIATNETKEGRQLNRRIEMRILRREFSLHMLPEGRIDSSAVLAGTYYPGNSQRAMMEAGSDRTKERHIHTVDFKKIVKRNTVSTMIVDTIPSELHLLAHSVVALRGVDSVKTVKNVMIVYCSQNDSAAIVQFVTEVADNNRDETTVHNSTTVIKKQQDGKITEEKTTPVDITIRKKPRLSSNH
jgi:uncharacterized repeat protein (TIGR01451 family)